MTLQVTIEQTGKSFHPSSDWQMLSDRPERFRFESMTEVREYLKERYGNSKRQPMYRDTKDGTIRCGWVIGFRNADWSHSPVQHWLQQDWVMVEEVTAVEVS